MASTGQCGTVFTVDLAEAQETVKSLYEYRDNFIEQNGIEKACNKKSMVAQEIKKTVTLLENFKEKIDSQAYYHLLLGKAYNADSSFNQEALNHLSRAVKLDPKLIEGWTQLGECYWKKGDVSTAYNCFHGALNHGQDKIALRSLSMAVRQLPGTAEEQQKRTQESVDKAKEAVTLDMDDGMSWFVLGNAYLAQFFKEGQDPRILQQCTTAYEKAAKDKQLVHYPDLHFNRAVVHQYKEEYKLALGSFSSASKLDPDWSAAKTKLSSLTKFLDDTQNLLKTKGRVKNKKLQTWLSKLSERELGSYAESSLSSPPKLVLLTELSYGANTGKIVVGSVVGIVTTEEKTPLVFGLVDRTEACRAVTIYNIVAHCGVKIGDSVAIPEPHVENVNFEFEGKIWDFQSIRVTNPLLMMINGRRFSADWIAFTSFTSNVQS